MGVVRGSLARALGDLQGCTRMPEGTAALLDLRHRCEPMKTAVPVGTAVPISGQVRQRADARRGRAKGGQIRGPIRSRPLRSD